MTEYIMDFSNPSLRAVVEHEIEIGAPIREEIVRCRDCKHYGQGQCDHDHQEPWRCMFWDSYLALPGKFCAWGEKRHVDE